MLMVSLFLVFGGVAMLYMGGKYLRLSWQSRDWPKVRGTIINRGTIRRREGAGTPKHQYFIYYKYCVAGQTYTSNRISFRPVNNPTHEERARFEDVVEVDVYYNPDHPQTAVIERSPEFTNYVAFAAGVGFIAAGISYFYYSF